MNKDVYGDETITEMWDPTNIYDIPDELKSILVNDNIGFKAKLYQRSVGGKVVSYCIAFAGTEDVKDIINDIKQGVGMSAQYQAAVTLAKTAVAKLSAPISFVGHSLGGGLASLAALVTNRPALTYNAASLSIPTMKKYNVLKSSTKQIDAYIVRNEPLNYFQTHNYLGIPQAQGNIHYIGNWPTYIIPLNPANHSINNVLEFLPHW